MNDVEEIKDIDGEVSSELSPTFNTCCTSELEELMFIQSHMHSPEEKQSVCSKNLILKTQILLYSQSTVDVVSNGNFLTKIHQVKTTLRIRYNAGFKTTNLEAICQSIVGCGSIHTELQWIEKQNKLSILDETDSGLDIDALKIVSEGINTFMKHDKAIILITHYQRLLDYIKPDFVHVMQDGKIIKTGTADLAKELELKGYEWLK